jgi:hypothetical protein
MVDTDLDLNIDISTVPDLPFHVLKQYYMQLYNQETRIGNKEFYILRVSYRLQELRHGGLSLKTKSLIKKLFEKQQRKKSLYPVGTVIVRTYKGTDYRVTILERGVDMDGTYYTSLSSAAHHITGIRTSGKRFFGVGQ